MLCFSGRSLDSPARPRMLMRVPVMPPQLAELDMPTEPCAGDGTQSAEVTSAAVPPDTQSARPAVRPSAPLASREHMMRSAVTKPRRFNYLWDADIINPTTSSTSDAPPARHDADADADADGRSSAVSTSSDRRRLPPHPPRTPRRRRWCASPDDDATCGPAGTPAAAPLSTAPSRATVHPPEAVK